MRLYTKLAAIEYDCYWQFSAIRVRPGRRMNDSQIGLFRARPHSALLAARLSVCHVPVLCQDE